jgi:hypothetical protein
MPTSLAHKMKTFATAGWQRQSLVAEACASLLSARVQLAILPFAKVSKGLGEFVAPDDPRATERAAPTTPEQARIARRVGWAVRVSAPFMPFRSVCLQQAMAAQSMLRRRGIVSVMHFGAQPGGKRPIDAHAWLDASGVKVTGYPLPAAMRAIACFV